MTALLRRFSRDASGVSAIEFGIIFPLMVFIYLGSVDITMLITADRRVTNIASAIGDLVGQATQLNDAEMADIFEAASAIIAPMPATNLSIVVTSVVADEDNETTVGWSKSYNGDAASAGSEISVPEGLTTPNSSVVVATVTYSYTSPTAHYLNNGAITLDETFYLRPRRTSAVQFVD